MIVNVRTGLGERSLDRTGYQPPTLGDFLKRALDRRGLGVGDVARKTGLSLEIIGQILANERRIDRKMARKLESVFPSTRRVLIRMQQQSDFFSRFGVLRPTSPLEQILVRRRFHRLLGQAGNGARLR